MLYKQGYVAIEKHCDKEGVIKHHVLTAGGSQLSIMIDEPNLYRLIARSKMKEARKFEKWIFEDVLWSGYNTD